MKIGDEVLIHGYVDEIRKDTIIIRNDGGYFGTVESEVVPYAKYRHLKNLVSYSADFGCTVTQAEKKLRIAEERFAEIEKLPPVDVPDIKDGKTGKEKN